MCRSGRSCARESRLARGFGFAGAKGPILHSCAIDLRSSMYIHDTFCTILEQSGPRGQYAGFSPSFRPMAGSRLADHRRPKRLGPVKNPLISREIWDRWPIVSVGHLWGGGRKNTGIAVSFPQGANSRFGPLWGMGLRRPRRSIRPEYHVI